MAEKTRKGTDPKLVAKPFSYKDLVSYQEGSIVSRTIMDKNEGTITVFAFAEGQRLSTHSAPFDALVEVIEGTGIITIEGVEHQVADGQQIIMPANKPHGVTAKEPFKMVLVMIRAA
ncbi:MAG: cupin domain-containing protein [Fibrobacteres bacterium]|nr:cupin domain-containing protein [Fibrobacterota bacterium]